MEAFSLLILAACVGLVVFWGILDRRAWEREEARRAEAERNSATVSDGAGGVRQPRPPRR
jgi:hypothetical protein